jgi:hydroxymethylglutaryl-CoA reductase (NADPH)
MSTSSNKAKRLLELFGKLKTFDNLLDEITFDNQEAPKDLKIPEPLSWSKDSQLKRLKFIKDQTGYSLSTLAGQKPIPEPDIFQGNIENFIGMTQVPTGVIGPLSIRGTLAQGEFYVPLATTEGALIASYHRGAKATRLCGGIVSVCLTEGVQRAPLFKFNSLQEVGKFMQWVLSQIEEFHKIVSTKSRYGR